MNKTNSLRAWFLAARPKTLTGAIAPVLVGGAFAIRQILIDGSPLATLNAHLIPLSLCLLFAVLMQIDANLINDYFDFCKGTDRADRLGPERACAQGWITPRAMRWGIAVMTVLSCLVGLAILLIHMQWELILVGLFCVIFCFLYTTHLSYLGWGDLLVILFFGLIPVIFTHYVMTADINMSIDSSSKLLTLHPQLSIFLAAFAMGLATDNLLMVNNYRDRHQDKVSGKRTIIVRIMAAKGQMVGERISRAIYLWLGIIATLLGILSVHSFSSLLLLPYLLLHIHAYRQMRTLDGRDLNRILGQTARNIFLFGFLLAISVLI